MKLVGDWVNVWNKLELLAEGVATLLGKNELRTRDEKEEIVVKQEIVAA